MMHAFTDLNISLLLLFECWNQVRLTGTGAHSGSLARARILTETAKANGEILERAWYQESAP